MKRISIIFMYLILTGIVSAQGIKREFRGSWIQCVNGQFQGMSTNQMQSNLTKQLNALQQCGINTIMFQVRAEGDALYESKYEPWSRFLTGTQGVAPQPYWDPLAWMITECHKRGMELHAWINPYRAKTATTNNLASTHPYMLNPERIFKYGKLLIFNPALKENRDYICKIVHDILDRYDVDGIHMDDYFYPYPEAGQTIPDEQEFKEYGRGFSDIASWRRDNVSRLISQLHDTIRSIKPWVKFGISPFGIYHNSRSGGNVPGSETKGLQNYDDLYADVLQWINQGWIDYNIPQIYWEIGHPAADYDTLIHWWSKFASKRPLIIGQDIERTVYKADLKNPQINQLPEKMRLQRTLPNIDGSCMWYSAAVTNNTGNIADALKSQYHKNPALQPLMTFITDVAPKKVKGVKVIWDEEDGPVLVWLPNKYNTWETQPTKYVVYRFEKGEKINIEDPSHIVCITGNTFYKLQYEGGNKKYVYAVTALNRIQNESKLKKTSVKL